MKENQAVTGISRVQNNEIDLSLEKSLPRQSTKDAAHQNARQHARGITNTGENADQRPESYRCRQRRNDAPAERKLTGLGETAANITKRNLETLAAEQALLFDEQHRVGKRVCHRTEGVAFLLEVHLFFRRSIVVRHDAAQPRRYL